MPAATPAMATLAMATPAMATPTPVAIPRALPTATATATPPLPRTQLAPLPAQRAPPLPQAAVRAATRTAATRAAARTEVGTEASEISSGEHLWRDQARVVDQLSSAVVRLCPVLPWWQAFFITVHVPVLSINESAVRSHAHKIKVMIRSTSPIRE